MCDFAKFAAALRTALAVSVDVETSPALVPFVPVPAPEPVYRIKFSHDRPSTGQPGFKVFGESESFAEAASIVSVTLDTLSPLAKRLFTKIEIIVVVAGVPDVVLATLTPADNSGGRVAFTEFLANPAELAVAFASVLTAFNDLTASGYTFIADEYSAVPPAVSPVLVDDQDEDGEDYDADYWEDDELLEEDEDEDYDTDEDPGDEDEGNNAFTPWVGCGSRR